MTDTVDIEARRARMIELGRLGGRASGVTRRANRERRALERLNEDATITLLRELHKQGVLASKLLAAGVVPGLLFAWHLAGELELRSSRRGSPTPTTPPMTPRGSRLTGTGAGSYRGSLSARTSFPPKLTTKTMGSLIGGMSREEAVPSFAVASR